MEALAQRVDDAIRLFKDRWPILKASRRFLERRAKTLSELPSTLLPELRRVREKSLRDLDESLRRLRESVERMGGEFYVAGDSAEAREIVLGICRRLGVRRVVKSKSMTSEEIGINQALEENGVEVLETDLGERIIQLLGDRPAHILAPAIHKTREEIASLFSRTMGEHIPPDPQRIVEAVRRSMRRKYLEADMTITGANIIIAETGAAVILTNEGNDRLALAHTPIHLIIAGVEKIVPTVKDALKIIRVLARSATGQRLSSYVSLIAPENPIDGSGRRRKTVFVLVDNGRMDALSDKEVSEALLCIRCSACLHVCPTYNMVGGHVFGKTYTGPMGIPWTLITEGLDDLEFAQLCYTCGLCREACPVDIDLPYINSVVKYRHGGRHGFPALNKWMARYEAMAKAGSTLSPIINPLLGWKPFRKFLEKVVGVDSRRPLPRFSWRHLGRRIGEMGEGRLGKIALFTDSLIYYSYPEIGEAMAKLLAEAGYKVVLPPQRSSGMPLIQYGFLDKARRIAEENIQILHKLVEQGYLIVALEPTAAYCLTEVYPKLCPGTETLKVAENTLHYFQLILENWPEFQPSLRNLDGMRLHYHLPCHSRGGKIYVREVLERLGARVSYMDLGCCGMAGTWGMKRDGHGYDLSIEIGRWMARQYEKAGSDTLTTESTVCALQFRHLSSMKVLHPIEVIYPGGLSR